VFTPFVFSRRAAPPRRRTSLTPIRRARAHAPTDNATSRGAALTAQEAIAAAEQVLPGKQAPEGERDPRWQAIIAVAEFVETDPEALWPFALRWGSHPNADLRMAIATCLLEHLLEHHFDTLITRVETAAMTSPEFAHTVRSCWKLGLTKESNRAARFDRLLAKLRDSEGRN
jgi:hypothetical protein